MENLVVGQRWINEAELSLGLGTLVGFDGRTVRIDFGSIEETRTYARESAALSRARFEVGDRLRSRDGSEITVQDLVEMAELILYQGIDSQGNELDIPEMELSDYTQLNRANQRLFAGQVDKPAYYQLRQSARKMTDLIAHSETRGMTSGRTSLIPHQLFIADEVSRRKMPRVLLADEVGLGKTIEAGLIINSRIISGEAQRILIIVPEHLINQWLVEMLRRFNLQFSLYDEARCQSEDVSALIAEGIFSEGDEILDEVEFENPFEAEQLVLCSLPLFENNQKIQQQALDAGWDMLVVDEAHHLEWTPESASQDYLIVEQFAQKIPSVLLLTATPEQLGKEGHFARLRLLDSARFFDYEKYIEEEHGYQAIAEVIDLLESDLSTLKDADWQRIQTVLDDAELEERLQRLRNSCGTGKDAPDAAQLCNQLISDLLDRHGTGRLLFRNTRSAIKGFPERTVLGYELDYPEQYLNDDSMVERPWREHLCPEVIYQQASDPSEKPWTAFDSRVDWLLSFLKQMTNQKVLVIAAKAETALELSEALRLKTGISAAVFHEYMSIVERDRAAAFFADDEFGAQCLICSEIGSEGRNFQFAHDMVLFDLPDNPDLLEQRIGRLDRIGQTENIKIHVPYLANSAQAMLFNFYHNALDAFEHTSIAAQSVIQEVSSDLEEQMENGELSGDLIVRATELRLEVEEELHSGRDRLLERNSCKPDVASTLIEKAEEADDNTALLQFIQLFSDNYGISYESQTNGSYVMRPTESMTSTLNGLPDEGLTLTYDRNQALSNEDMHFFTWDHPVVISALDSVLTAELGNTTLVTMKVPGLRPGTMMLESIFVLETPLNKSLQAGRYLPSSRIRVMLDQSGKPLEKLTEALIDKNQQIVKRHIGGKIAKTKRPEIQALLDKATAIATASSGQIRAKALVDAEQRLDQEIVRLEQLQKVNPSVRDEEILALRKNRDQLLGGLKQTEMSLDALRVIVFT